MTDIIQFYLANQEDSDLVTEDYGIQQRFKTAINSHQAIVCCDSADNADIVIVCQQWSFKLPDYGKQLLSDPFFCEFAHKIFVINYDDVVGEGFLPGCYVALQNSYYDPTRFRPVAYPKSYNSFVTEQINTKEYAKTLFWFRGTLHSHPIRSALFNELKDHPDGLMVDVTKNFHSHTENDKKDYVTEMLGCDFVLCPRGAAPNSYRLYEAMSMGKCPVIISDEWVETVGPTWANCSIRIAEKDLSHIPHILKEHQANAKTLGDKAKTEWLAHFSDENKNRAFIEQILALYRQAQPATKSLSQYKRHWQSRSFLRNNKWLLSQKIARKMKHLFA